MPGSPTSWIADASAPTRSLLQLVISDPWFAWLHSLSELIVRIDESARQGCAEHRSRTPSLLFEQVEKLLTASETGEDSQRRYYEALQRQPAVVLAHAGRAAHSEGAPRLTADLVPRSRASAAECYDFAFVPVEPTVTPAASAAPMPRPARRADMTPGVPPPDRPKPAAASSIAPSSMVRSAPRCGRSPGRRCCRTPSAGCRGSSITRWSATTSASPATPRSASAGRSSSSSSSSSVRCSPAWVCSSRVLPARTITTRSTGPSTRRS